VANRTATKRELCERIARQTGQTQLVTKQVVQLFLDEIIDELARGGRLELRNFGVFDTRVQPARKARNPKTDEVVHVGPKAVVSFKIGKAMHEKAQRALPLLESRAPRRESQSAVEAPQTSETPPNPS
jgi:integration host factor subunit beta